jgi:hypothetical protein
MTYAGGPESRLLLMVTTSEDGQRVGYRPEVGRREGL